MTHVYADHNQIEKLRVKENNLKLKKNGQNRKKSTKNKKMEK